MYIFVLSFEFYLRFFFLCSKQYFFPLKFQVLDATSDEPWGPHGTTLSELSHATKKL